MTNTNSFLSHYGIKGMKWGVLRSDAQIARSGGSSVKEVKKAAKSVKMVNPDELQKRETKAKKFDDEVVRLRKETAATQAKLKNAGPIAQQAHREKIAENEKLIKTAEKDAIAAREGRMTSGQKKLLIGTAVAAGVLAAYGTHHMVQSGGFNRMMINGRMFMDKDTQRFKRNDKLSDPNFSAEDIMKHVVPGVNPDYGSWGTNMNCRRATFAYEMRRRGFDVQATKTSNASGQTLFGLAKATTTGDQGTSIFKDMDYISSYQAIAAGSKNKIYASASGKSVFDELSKQPNGSRGEFGVMWRSAVPGIPGGGHSMAYEIIKGKAHIFDAQTGEEYKQGHSIFSSIQEAGFTRLDNVDLNMDFLSKWVR